MIDGRAHISAGWGLRSQWYRNIFADPVVTVQHDHRTYAAVATRVTDPTELTAVYHLARARIGVWQDYLAS